MTAREQTLIVRKKFLLDPRLSAKAKGLLGVLLVRAANREPVTLEDMIESCADGSHAVRSGLQELEDLKYLWRERRGQGWSWHVTDDAENHPVRRAS